jgi:hypothetical protein
MKKSLLLLCASVILIKVAFSQDMPTVKFGKISATDFTVNSPVVDSNSDAIVLADMGTCKFVGNNKGWFSIIFTEYKRIKLFNKNGFAAANIHIGLYKYGTAMEKLKDLKAATYNLEGGSIRSIKLDEKEVFQEALSKNYVEKKFAFPGIKEGCIIEYSYQIESDFLFELHPWKFQGEYPCLWSSYEVQVPAIFNYTILKQGDLNYFINTTGQKNEVFNVRQQPGQSYPPEAEQVYAVNTSVTVKNWVMKNVPALRRQDYTSSIENYISKMEFQLSEYRFPDEPVENKMKNWDMVSKELLKADDFGGPLYEENVWVSEELKNVKTDGVSDEQKARNVFAYMRDNYTCTGKSGIFLSEEATFKSIIKKRSGTVSDLNLLLVAMIRASRLEAYPVILSTRAHGSPHQHYPLLEDFDYIICQLNIGGAVYYLDASNPYLGFGKLQPKCYNGMARIVNHQSKEVNLNADDLQENSVAAITLVNNGSGLSGTCHRVLGYNGSLALREESFSNNGKKNYFEDEEKKYSDDVSIKNGKFDSLKTYDDPVGVTYDVELKLKDEELIDLNPMLAEQMKENPFKAQDRIYPVELPFASNRVYIFAMEVPHGYRVEELPKSQILSMPDGKAKFEYQIAQDVKGIQLRCSLQISKTFYSTDDYQNLRAFFAQIIKKESELIVFKKS